MVHPGPVGTWDIWTQTWIALFLLPNHEEDAHIYSAFFVLSTNIGLWESTYLLLKIYKFAPEPLLGPIL